MATFAVVAVLGSRTLGPVAIPVEAKQFSLALDAATMRDVAGQVRILLDLSLDGGATWATDSRGPATDPFPVEMTLVGGAVDRLGLPLTSYSVSCPLPQPGNATRQVRATLVASGIALSTTATVSVT